jgi:hypothetical protein
VSRATSESGPPAAHAADSGLRCPRCGYNLTGLSSPRCPECGTEVDWEHARFLAANPPQIAFERAAGARRIPAFIVTWLTVLFMPWVFARQAVRRISARWGLLFAAVCFAGTASALLIDYYPGVWAAWMFVAALYILAQTLCLTLLDARSLPTLVDSARFWLAVSGYTSAITLTEVLSPPLLTLDDLVAFTTGQWHRIPSYDSPYLFQPTWAALINWTQLTLWLAGIGCCFYARRRARGGRRSIALLATIVVVIGLLFLYAFAVQRSFRLVLIPWLPV